MHNAKLAPFAGPGKISSDRRSSKSRSPRHLLWGILKKLEQLNVRGSWRVRKLILKYCFDNKYIKTPYLGHSIYVCPLHTIDQAIFESGINEPDIISTIQTFVSEGFSFIDIGANIGSHTLAAAFARRNEKQDFISFEPQKSVFGVLKKNCLVNRLAFTDCRQEGVGDKDAYLTINESVTHNKGRSSFWPLENTKPGHQIKVSTLNTLFLNNEELSSKSILIKMDTEGYELPIIRGGVEWLSQVKSLAIISEVWPDLMQRNNLAVAELFALLKKCGLEHYKIFRDYESVAGSDAPNGYNIIAYKGMAAERVLSMIDARFFRADI